MNKYIVVTTLFNKLVVVEKIKNTLLEKKLIAEISYQYIQIF